MNTLETQAGLATTPGYQYAQQVGNQLFVAGQVPHDADGNLVGLGSSQTQANQCLKNLRILMNLYSFGDLDIRQLKVYVVGNQANLTVAWQAVQSGLITRCLLPLCWGFLCWAMKTS